MTAGIWHFVLILDLFQQTRLPWCQWLPELLIIMRLHLYKGAGWPVDDSEMWWGAGLELQASFCSLLVLFELNQTAWGTLTLATNGDTVFHRCFVVIFKESRLFTYLCNKLFGSGHTFLFACFLIAVIVTIHFQWFSWGSLTPHEIHRIYLYHRGSVHGEEY